MRITSKYLVEFINKKFIEFEIFDYEVYDVVSTKFNSNVIEGGAACLYVKFRNKTTDNLMSKGYFYSFYRMKDLQWYVNNGYELFIKGDKYSISNFELDVRKTVSK